VDPFGRRDRQLYREALTMAEFSHPNILAVRGVVINGIILSSIMKLSIYGIWINKKKIILVPVLTKKLNK